LALADRLTEAEQQLHQYVEWFGKANVFVELQNNYLPGDDIRTHRLVCLAKQVGVGYVATGNVHYHERARHRLQDVLVAIRHRTTLDGCHRQRRGNSEFHLATDREMRKRFTAYPEAIAATGAIAKRCANFNLNNDLGYSFPTYEDVADGETPDDALRRICLPRFADRYPPGSPRRLEAEERLDHELSLIARHRLAGFFLIHFDLMRLAEEVAIEVRGANLARSQSNLPPGRGRGSSVSSIVCYLIGLSPADPLEHGLKIGRFLNEEASEVPDIDLDFPRDIREALLARIHHDYGERAAMICAFSTYRLRSAVRDIGKALGLPIADLDRIAKLAEPRSASELASEMQRVPTFAGRLSTPPWSHLIELASQLSGHPRHVSQHSGGVIVSSKPISQIVPVQPAKMEGRYLSQWDKDSVDDAGMVKIDFLALGMLSAIEETLSLIGELGAKPPDLSRIDYADSAVYAMIQRGDTLGTFQIESRAQIQTTLRTTPNCLADLVVQVAIVRPGPIIGGATTPYLQRRRDPSYEVTYDHPLLEPVLAETMGVVIYQDQVLEIAVELAGFSPGQADSLRRAMTRRRSEEAIEAHRRDFYTGAQAKGVPLDVAERVFEKLRGFSSYGFPKGHAASFGILAYQSAFLKHYFPAEFLCALINNQPMGFYPAHVLVHEAKRRGIFILTPGVNTSKVRSSVPRRSAVQIGFTHVKGLSEEQAMQIVAERQANGRFQSLADFIRRVVLPTEIVESMISIGMFDEFGLRRRESLWQLGLFVKPQRFGGATVKSQRRKGDRHAGIQIALPLPVEQDMVEMSPLPAVVRMASDYRVLGMSARYHPMGLMRSRLPRGFITAETLPFVPDGVMIQIGGLVVCRQRPETAKGVTFLLIEDEHGLSNVIVYKALYEKYRPTVRGESFLLITGRIQKQENTINIVATAIESLTRYIDAKHADSDVEQTDLAELSPVSHNYR